MNSSCVIDPINWRCEVIVQFVSLLPNQRWNPNEMDWYLLQQDPGLLAFVSTMSGYTEIAKYALRNAYDGQY